MCFLPHKKNALEGKNETNCSQTPFLHIRIPGYIPIDACLSPYYQRDSNKIFFILLLVLEKIQNNHQGEAFSTKLSRHLTQILPLSMHSVSMVPVN